MASDRRSAWNSENFYFAFIFRHNSEKKSSSELIVKEKIRVLFNFLVTSAEVTKFATFCKQNPWREESVMAVGVYRGITDRLLTNQSARTIAAI